MLFIARFRFLFQRYASALLLSMTLRQFIKATKKRFLFCIKNRPGFHCGNRGGSFALFVLFQALTQNLAGVLDRNLGSGQLDAGGGLQLDEGGDQCLQVGEGLFEIQSNFFAGHSGILGRR